MMLEISSTRQHDLEQASAAFRMYAEVLGELRGQLLKQGFTVEGAESITESLMIVMLDD